MGRSVLLEVPEIDGFQNFERIGSAFSPGEVRIMGATVLLVQLAMCGVCVCSAHAKGKDDRKVQAAEPVLPPPELVPLLSTTPAQAPAPEVQMQREITINDYRLLYRDPDGKFYEFTPENFPYDPDGWDLIVECNPDMPFQYWTVVHENDAMETIGYESNTVIVTKGKVQLQKQVFVIPLSAVKGRELTLGGKFTVKVPAKTGMKSNAFVSSKPSGEWVGFDFDPLDVDQADAVSARTPDIEPEPSSEIPSASSPMENNGFNAFAGIGVPIEETGMGEKAALEVLVGGGAEVAELGIHTGLGVEGVFSWIRRSISVANTNEVATVFPQPEVSGQRFRFGVNAVLQQNFLNREFGISAFASLGPGIDLWRSGSAEQVGFFRVDPRQSANVDSKSRLGVDAEAAAGVCGQVGPAEICAGGNYQHGFTPVQEQIGADETHLPSQIGAFFRLGYRGRKWR